MILNIIEIQDLFRTCSHSTNTSTVITELPHNLDVGDQVIITNVTDTNNTSWFCD